MIPLSHKNKRFYGVGISQDTFYELCEAKYIRFEDSLSPIEEDFQKYLNLAGGDSFFTLLDDGNIFFGYPVYLGQVGDNPADLIADVCYAISSFDRIVCFRFGPIANTFDCFRDEYRMFKIL